MRFRLTFVVIVLAGLATGGPSAQSKELARGFLSGGAAGSARPLIVAAYRPFRCMLGGRLMRRSSRSCLPLAS